MKIVETHLLQPGTLSGWQENHYVYCGLDSCVTLEILETLLTQLDNHTGASYSFSKSLQGPVLEMRLRGIRVDLARRGEVVREYAKLIERLGQQLNRICEGAYDTPVNFNSPKQVANLFYNLMGLPEVKFKGKVTTNRDALEKLSKHFLAQPIVAHILKMRDLSKKVSTLKTEVDNDSRIRTSFNIAGTNTSRLSSSMSDYGTGGNLQNIEQKLRQVFIADTGFKFANIDLEQADSRNLGYLCASLFGDYTYLDACESGDLHTTVCKLGWKHLPWTGDLQADREVAEQPFYRQHSYRHMAKVLGHGTNYLGTPPTMAMHTKIESGVIRQFQETYFKAFPAIKQLHEHVAKELVEFGYLVNPFGRKRWFFGRRNEAATIREAVAYLGQSSTAEEINRAMLNIFNLNKVQLLCQVHDSLLVQYPEDQEDELMPQLMAAMQVPLTLPNGRSFIVPAEAKVGWNWANQETDKTGKVIGNFDGLMKYKGHDSRKRQGQSALSFLDFRV